MRQRLLVVSAVCAVALVAAAMPVGAWFAHAAVAPAAGFWGRAITVPGLGALNTGRQAQVLSVSCPSPGNCAAGGSYRNHGIQGFVAVKKKGRWARAIEVPGLGALNKGGNAEVLSVSCTSPGHCTAGGYYGNHSKNPYDVTSGRGFVVSEQNGRWGKAVQVPGLAALNKGGNAEVSSVSCSPRGGCAAVGFYRDGAGHQQGFVAVKANGLWGKAVEVPGLGVLNKGGNAEVSSVSCAAPGNCAAGGTYYSDADGHHQAFVVSEKNGSWGTARPVAANLNTDGRAFVNTVSCASAGNCAAGGEFSNAIGAQAFVVSEVNGTWAAAHAVVGTLNDSGDAQVTSVSCASVGNCSAGGTFDIGGYDEAFLVSEKNGHWGNAFSVPGLNKATRESFLTSVSCASAGNCAAGGSYDGDPFGAWVAREKNGGWGKWTGVPGLGVLNKGTSVGVNSVSCASATSCVAGGSYQEAGRLALEGFVT